MTESELDFKLLFEGSPDILLVLLPDAPRYTMVAATEARLQATHTTREDTMGRGLFEVFPDNPGAAPRLMKMIFIFIFIFINLR